jgi:hypothetical protein
VSVAATAIVVGLFLATLTAQFASGATSNPARKLIWRRVMQGFYLAFLVAFGIEFVPVAWPYIEKVLAAQ